jgi:hypothetical protein
MSDSPKNPWRACLYENKPWTWIADCPFCGAKAGTPCVTVIQNKYRRQPGRVGKYAHVDRLNAGYPDGRE